MEICPRIFCMGVDIERFQSGQRTRLRRELPENEFLILFVGRLVEDKGLTDLLTAMTLLPENLYGKTILWVVGDGHYRTRIEQEAETRGMRNKVRFWGPLSNELLPNFYAAADLLVVPSEATEGLGVVLLEAFAARLCVVATRVGGVSEVVEHGSTGVLVEPRNPQQLSLAIENLLRDGSRRAELAENGFAKARKYYDWEKIAATFEDLYRNLIKNKNGGDN